MVRDGARAPPHHEGQDPSFHKLAPLRNWPCAHLAAGLFRGSMATLPLHLKCRILLADPLLQDMSGKIPARSRRI